MRLAIYTALFGHRDEYRLPRPGTELVCFTDRPDLAGPGVTVMELPVAGHHRRSARWVKCHPHLLLPQYDAWVWIDANMEILADADLGALVAAAGRMGVLAHPDRNCVYDEATMCISLRLDHPRVIAAQARRYREAGHPPGAGLAETGLLVRRNDPGIVAFNAAWWSEIASGSCRDQISFPVIAQRMGIDVTYLGTRHDNPWVVVREHSQKEEIPWT